MDTDYEETVALLQRVRERAGIDATLVPERVRTIFARTGCMISLQDALQDSLFPRPLSEARTEEESAQEREQLRADGRARAIGHAVLLSLGPMRIEDLTWSVLDEAERRALDLLSRLAFGEGERRAS